MSFLLRYFFGDNDQFDRNTFSRLLSFTDPRDEFEMAWAPVEQRLDELRNFFDFRSFNPDFVCREDLRTNQVECLLNVARGFKPENIEVNVKGRQVEMKARQEDSSEDGTNYSFREVRRTFTMPNSADVDNLTASMEPGGRFVLRAPLLKDARSDHDGVVPIQVNRIPS